jgi:hypothetical protein
MTPGSLNAPAAMMPEFRAPCLARLGAATHSRADLPLIQTKP